MWQNCLLAAWVNCIPSKQERSNNPLFRLGWVEPCVRDRHRGSLQTWTSISLFTPLFFSRLFFPLSSSFSLPLLFYTCTLEFSDVLQRAILSAKLLNFPDFQFPFMPLPFRLPPFPFLLSLFPPFQTCSFPPFPFPPFPFPAFFAPLTPLPLFLRTRFF